MTGTEHRNEQNAQEQEQDRLVWFVVGHIPVGLAAYQSRRSGSSSSALGASAGKGLKAGLALFE